jgi:hypothetical protein
MKTPEEMAEEYVWKHYGYSAINHQLDFLAGYQAAMNSPEKQDSCEHILDMEKMVDVNLSSGWISVKDRLPEIHQQFTAFVENKEVCNCCRYQNRSSDNSPSFYASTKTGLLICGLESISHWMPLPEAPKEEK